MKGIMNWLKNSYHSYCELAVEAMDCGLDRESYQRS